MPTSCTTSPSGSNGLCSAAYLCTARVGYDGPTGLGTPNGPGAFAAREARRRRRRTSRSPRARPARPSLPGDGHELHGRRPEDRRIPRGRRALGSPGCRRGVVRVCTGPGRRQHCELEPDGRHDRGAVPGSYPLTSRARAARSRIRSPRRSSSSRATTPDFAVAVSPASRTVTAGGGTTYTVSLTRHRRILGHRRSRGERSSGRRLVELQPFVAERELVDVDGDDRSAARRRARTRSRSPARADRSCTRSRATPRRAAVRVGRLLDHASRPRRRRSRPPARRTSRSRSVPSGGFSGQVTLTTSLPPRGMSLLLLAEPDLVDARS